MSYCIKCGTELPSDVGICYKCGYPVVLNINQSEEKITIKLYQKGIVLIAMPYLLLFFLFL